MDGSASGIVLLIMAGTLVGLEEDRQVWRRDDRGEGVECCRPDPDLIAPEPFDQQSPESLDRRWGEGGYGHHRGCCDPLSGAPGQSGGWGAGRVGWGSGQGPG